MICTQHSPQAVSVGVVRTYAAFVTAHWVLVLTAWARETAVDIRVAWWRMCEFGLARSLL